MNACRNRCCPIQRRLSTSSCCMTAIWPAGPPNVCNDTRNHAFVASRSGITSARVRGPVLIVASMPHRLASSAMTSLDDLVTLVRAPAFALSESSGAIDGGLRAVRRRPPRALAVHGGGGREQPRSRPATRCRRPTRRPSWHHLRRAGTPDAADDHRRDGGDPGADLGARRGRSTSRWSSGWRPTCAACRGQGGLAGRAGPPAAPTATRWCSSTTASASRRRWSPDRPADKTLTATVPLRPGEVREVTLVGRRHGAGPAAWRPRRAVRPGRRPVGAGRPAPRAAAPPVARGPRRAAPADPEPPADQFVGAGTPWYLTLFGRDSLWTARMLLPLGTDLAGGTLRALARRRGRRTDPAGAEEPGKILHELRGSELTHADGGVGSTPMTLPPVYYGTVDATPLWVALLHDAWRAGPAGRRGRGAAARARRHARLDRRAARGRARLPDLPRHRRRRAGQPGLEGLAATRCSSPTAGWPMGPIALCEVQAYAVEALRSAAPTLLDAFGRPGADEHRRGSRPGRRPLPRALLGRRRARPVPGDRARRLGHAGRHAHLEHRATCSAPGSSTPTRSGSSAHGSLDLSSGYGLRTLVDSARGYDPLSYHCGSVWTHDTAIAMTGLARSGASPEALRVLSDGLLDAAASFDWSLPELYGGQPAVDGPPVPYPRRAAPRPGPPPPPSPCSRSSNNAVDPVQEVDHTHRAVGSPQMHRRPCGDHGTSIRVQMCTRSSSRSSRNRPASCPVSSRSEPVCRRMTSSASNDGAS